MQKTMMLTIDNMFYDELQQIKKEWNEKYEREDKEKYTDSDIIEIAINLLFMDEKLPKKPRKKYTRKNKSGAVTQKRSV